MKIYTIANSTNQCFFLFCFILFHLEIQLLNIYQHTTGYISCFYKQSQYLSELTQYIFISCSHHHKIPADRGLHSRQKPEIQLLSLGGPTIFTWLHRYPATSAYRQRLGGKNTEKAQHLLIFNASTQK